MGRQVIIALVAFAVIVIGIGVVVGGLTWAAQSGLIGSSSLVNSRWAGHDSTGVANLTFGLHSGGDADFSMDLPGKDPITGTGT